VCRFIVQSDKVKTLMSRAKYGCASVSNPVRALQHDSDINADVSYDDQSVRAMYSDQLTQLENLITRQHICQQQMRDQLVAVEKQYHSVSLSRFSVNAGNRAFSVAGPTVWNSLRDSWCDPAIESERFRRDLKTHFFVNIRNMSALEVSPFPVITLYKSSFIYFTSFTSF